MSGADPTGKAPAYLPHEEFLAAKQVCAVLGIGKTTLYRKIAEGVFPRPVPMFERPRWVRSEIRRWMQDRIAERDARVGEPLELRDDEGDTLFSPGRPVERYGPFMLAPDENDPSINPDMGEE